MIADLEPDPATKGSGVEWLGEVPGAATPSAHRTASRARRSLAEIRWLG